MAVILTVTLNAALDVTYPVARMDSGRSHRVLGVLDRAGGKGINVARVLQALSHDVVTTGFIGGPTGDQILTDLSSLGITTAFVRVSGDSRRTVTVVDRRSGEATTFNEPGPAVTDLQWQSFLGTYRTLLPKVDAVAICGSRPPGLPDDSNRVLVELARRHRRTVILDVGGEALMAAVPSRPDVVKPNAAELQSATGVADPVRAAQALRSGGAESVVASMGPRGILAVTRQGSWWAKATPIQPVNPTGAGDAVVAALAVTARNQSPWPERLRWATALSAASVLTGAAGDVSTEVVDRLLRQVVVERIDLSSAHDS